MHDFINDLTPPNISELLRYSLEKNSTIIQRLSAVGNLCLKDWRTEHMKFVFFMTGCKELE